MSNLNQNGFSFLRLLPKSVLVLLLFAAFLIFVNPVHTNAGALQNTDQVFKDISDGKLNAGAQEWIRKNNSEEDYEWMNEYFGEDNANKFYNNEYIQSGKAGSPVINDLLGTGVDVVVWTYGGLGGNTPSLGEVIELSWWQKAALGIRDIYGAAKNIFRVFGPSNKEVREAVPGQIGRPLKKDNCDFSHYQIKYNEPQPTIEAIRDKITSLNIGRYSAMNSDGRTVIEIRGNKKDGSLTKTELDKLNKGLAELGIFEPQIFSSLETINGVCGRPDEPLIINPEDIEKLWPQSITQTIQQPQVQQGKVASLVISPDGLPVSQAKYWLVDSQGRNPDPEKYEFRYTIQTGRLETPVVPNGQYMLNITCELHCMFGDKFAQSIVNDIYAKWSKTLLVEVKGSDIWLDKIILVREK